MTILNRLTGRTAMRSAAPAAVVCTWQLSEHCHHYNDQALVHSMVWSGLNTGCHWHAGEEEEEGVTSDGNGCAQHAANRESVRRFRRKHRTRSAFADWQESAPSASRDGPLEGVILRSQLMVLLTKRVCCSYTRLHAAMVVAEGDCRIS